jgi:hypothetical protein
MDLTITIVENSQITSEINLRIHLGVSIPSRPGFHVSPNNGEIQYVGERRERRINQKTCQYLESPNFPDVGRKS